MNNENDPQATGTEGGIGLPETTGTLSEANAKTYLSLKTGKANKTGQRSHGQIHYRILTDAVRQALYVTITGNDGGGYYSKEIVPFTNIENCLEGINTDMPLSSKLFQPAFIGQSSNNAGFLAAILRAENLLAAVPDSQHHHALQPHWEDWKANTLALSDQVESYQPELPKPRLTKVANQKTSSSGDGKSNPLEADNTESTNLGSEADANQAKANLEAVGDLEATADENITDQNHADLIQQQTSSQDELGAEALGIAGETDKSKAKKPRAEKRQQPDGGDSENDRAA